ncbi:hypothetical protein DICVIV_01304 [Dictyocaulus viviparus]|uniref:Uncharacterized protein n=1 Tax=Dictyocaulus viviparus TaxID=29172 RepID=A0A0D8Y8Z0_DICVI|nr:hypothetical protein DICVIV_01304 [Dictyocaulus viviparus]
MWKFAFRHTKRYSGPILSRPDVAKFLTVGLQKGRVFFRNTVISVSTSWKSVSLSDLRTQKIVEEQVESRNSDKMDEAKIRSPTFPVRTSPRITDFFLEIWEDNEHQYAGYQRPVGRMMLELRTLSDAPKLYRII